jgi:hypothetical protein
MTIKAKIKIVTNSALVFIIVKVKRIGTRSSPTRHDLFRLDAGALILCFVLGLNGKPCTLLEFAVVPAHIDNFRSGAVPAYLSDWGENP